MFNKKNKKLMSLVMCGVLSASLFIGCGNKTDEVMKTDGKEQSITYNLVSDAGKFDPRDCVGVDQRTVINQCFVGLVKIDMEGKIIPAMAEKWEISDDGKVYTFHLNKEAKWQDGKKIVAVDFEYAWKTAIDPTFAFKSIDAYFDILNAEEFSKGKAKIEEVGVKAVDENTLKVTLKVASPFFLNKITQANFSPVRKDIVEKDQKGWTLKPDTYIGNGPFKMTVQKPRDEFEFIKNDNYLFAKDVKLTKLAYVFVEEATTALAGFKTGTIDVLDQVPPTEIENLTTDGFATPVPMCATYFYSFNMGKNANGNVQKTLWNKDVRIALNLAIDREAIIKTILKGGQIPATGMVPAGVKTPDGKEFYETKKYFDPKGDVKKAKELLAKAGFPDGKDFPVLELFYNTSQSHAAVAQAVQDMWKTNLGIEIKLVNKETKVFAEERAKGLTQIVRGGNECSPNYPSILDIFTETNLNTVNDPKWVNAEFDTIIKKANNESDVNKIFENYAKAQDILMEDMPVIPMYYYTNILIKQKDIKGIIKDVQGPIYFEWTYRE